jgi:hypothetical protein
MTIKKISRRRKTGIVLVVLLSGLLSILLLQISAASASLLLSPSTKSIVQGKTFTVTVSADTDAPITVGEVAITYDPNLLKLSNIDYTNSPLTKSLPDSSDNPGSLQINRYTFGGTYPSGKFTIATLTFTGLKTGNAQISIDKSESTLYEQSELAPDILTSVTGTSVKISSPPTREPVPAPSTKPTKTNNTSDQGTDPQRQTTTSTSTSNANPSQAQTEEQSDGVPALITNTGTPPTNLPAPGQSINGSSVSIGERALQMVRNIVPAVVLVGIAAVIGWVIFKRSGHNSSLYGSKPAQTAGPGVVFDGSHTVKTNQDNNQQPPSPVQ